MRVTPRILAALAAALFTVGTAILTGAADQGSMRGTVLDESGGLLPGVTIVATNLEGEVLTTVVTDATGHFALAAVPPGVVHLTFELAGFTTAAVDVTIRPGVESRLGQRLALAGRSESVEVRGQAPAVVPAPRQIVAPPPPPPAKLVAVAPHDHASVCGPAKRNHGIDALGTVRAVRHGELHDLYSAGDELTIDGGTLDGLDAGRNLTVRRYFTLRGFVSGANAGEHTAGLLQIVSAEEHTSVGVVIYACDEMRPGDFLAAFNPEPVRAPQAPAVPDFDQAARILFADADALLGAPGRSMVIDRGADYGWRAGQRVTLFRRENKRRPTIVGDAVVVAVRVDSATIRILNIIDAVSPGDWAAPQRGSVSTASVTPASSDRSRR
ncbi:MAG TPA: carboxypeptidase-like regulatory domain-containing protein [Vicinamibacterales bacterium]|jgi:hypothetical protein